MAPYKDIISTLAARYLRRDRGREDVVSRGRKLRRLFPGGPDLQVTLRFNEAAPMRAFMEAMPIVIRDRLRELFADVGRFEVGSVPDLLQYRSLLTLYFAIQVSAVLAETGWHPSVGADFPGEEFNPGQFECAELRTASRRELGPGQRGSTWRFGVALRRQQRAGGNHRWQQIDCSS
jgi:hypothetical protein